MFRVASQAEAKWLLFKIQQGRTFSLMPKPVGWAAGHNHLGPGRNSLKDVVNQAWLFIFPRRLWIWAAATTKSTRILGNWGPKVSFPPNNDQKFMCCNECLVGHAAAKSFCIANKAPFTLIVEVPFQTGYCLVLYVCFAYIAGGGSHESKWFF